MANLLYAEAILVQWLDKTYKYLETAQTLPKAFERFLRILCQLCRSTLRLIILEEKFRYKSQGMRVEKELFRTESGV